MRNKARSTARAIIYVLILPLMFATAGWITSSYFNATDNVTEVTIEAAPISVAVESQVLESVIDARGDIVLGGRRALTFAAAVGIPEGDLIYTDTPISVGDDVQEGTLLAEISTRPVIALQGGFPMFRPLRYGDEGRDVLQLEAALNRLNLLSSAPDERFDRDTETAVLALYESTGYDPIEIPFEAESTLAELEAHVDQAEEALDQATQVPEPTGAEDELQMREQAEEVLQIAVQELTDFQDSIGVYLPQGELVFLPDLPMRAVESAMHIGATPGEGELVLAADDEAKIEVESDAELMAEAEVGDPAEVLDNSGAVLGEASVQTIGASDSGASLLTIIPDFEVAQLIGANLHVRIIVGSTTETALVVPSSAVFVDEQGESFVTVTHRQGLEVAPGQDIKVSVGLSANGLVEISPLEETVTTGDRVLVGYDG